MSVLTSWRKLIAIEMNKYGDSLDGAVMVPDASFLDREFISNSYCGIYGDPFTVWTASRVYFPLCYDGTEWCGSVSRHPDGKATEHMGA